MEIAKSTNRKPLVISVTSGKGGVGKTLASVSIAGAASDYGYKVLLIDGDLGLANVDVVLGLQSRYNVVDVLDGRVDLEDIILTGPKGMRIIPSGSGVTRLTKLSQIERLQLMDQIDNISEKFDIIIIDTGAGVSDNVLNFLNCSDKILVVTTPEPHAMTDAYALIKVMNEEQITKQIDFVVNMVRSQEEGVAVAERLKEVSKKFIGADIFYRGGILHDPMLQKAVKQRSVVKNNGTFTVAGQRWNEITRDLLEEGQGTRDMDQIWKNLLWKEEYQSGLKERFA